MYGNYGQDRPMYEVESDESLRKRLLYVAGDGPVLVARICAAKDAALEAVAEEYGLKRSRTGQGW